MKLKGKIKSFLFNNNDNFGVAIFTLMDNDKRSTVITGNICLMKIGVIYEVEGKNTIDPKNNRQSFLVSSFKIIKEFSNDYYIKYLSSSLFPTIGKVLASEIVNHFKEDIFEKIITQPEELFKINGMTETKSEIILDVVKTTFQNNEIMDKFVKHDLKLEVYNILDKKFIDKEELKSILENDFYSYWSQNKFSNFIDIDKIALAFGEEEFGKVRISWWASYIGEKILMATGNTYFDLTILKNELKKVFPYLEFSEMDHLLMYAKENNILIFENKKIYTKESYDDEKYIATRLKEIENQNHQTKAIDFEKEILIIEKYVGEILNISNFQYNDEQKFAIKNFYENSISIITGGPGTGKTTVIIGIVKMYEVLFGNNDFSIAAPTGRAASRIKETSNYNAQTIHRLLKYIGNNNFEYNLERQLSKEMLIIDECSMIDNHLFASLLKGITDVKKIVLVGDVNQLPSVSYGNVFEDIIDSKQFSTTTLIKNNRTISNDNKNSIIDLSIAIKENNIEDFNFKETNNLEVLFSNDENEIKNFILNIYSKHKPSHMSDELFDLQIIAPMYKGAVGLEGLNKLIQNNFNDKTTPNFKRGETNYYINDKVMYLENDPILELSNGDVGYIESFNTIDNKVSNALINFNSLTKKIEKHLFEKINLNYACSIHKTQGSEYKNVILVLDETNNASKFFLNKKMVYTAITRAKEKLYIISSEQLFKYACQKDMKTRQTTLKERLELIN
ncbi:SF1B family DNA helicase RecD2 [Spiroplasma culicicola]|uniref:Exodeoxyribonuclease V subunit alpha n=1 Tax=Spiroplasma culicicola AES-1 TaxID=1276246 RepID=W6A783_9MOLU|nr:AAA family ATPase [Spiroplasma culicicola]AHI52857.1 exodeoxyribonuclease V subunit alpha [Spiroplasma culicicola AES-1]